MFICDIQKEKDLMEMARNALLAEKKYQSENRKVNVLTEAYEQFEKADHGKNLYEEYDEAVFESKLAVDMMFYKNLFLNLDESHRVEVQKTLANTYRAVKEIYEFVNIKPEFFSKTSAKLLESTLGESERVIKDVITEALDHTFYDLTPEQRLEKYGERVTPLAKKLIQESCETNESLQFSVKTVIMEDILTKISFPKMTWTRVKHLCESEDFGKIFDQSKLVEIVETFENHIKKLSKYVAASV